MRPEVFKVGEIWHYRFAVNGKRTQKTTREKTKRRAQEIADDAYDAAKLRARGREPVPTLRRLAVMWIAAHECIGSAAHLKNVGVFSKHHLFDLADIAVDRLTTELIEQARQSYARDHAPASVNQWVKTLKLLVNWAKRRKMIKDVPFEIGLVKSQKKPRAMLPANLAVRWLHAIDRSSNSRAMSAAVRLAIGLGLRESEIVSARWEWMDWDRRSYTPGKTKDRKASAIPVPDWLFEYLSLLRQESGLIVTRANGAPIYAGFMRAPMIKANRESGVPHLSPHRLRGTFATMLGEAGTPVQEIQRVMRHRSILTTAAYLETNPDLTRAGQRHMATRLGLSNTGKLDGTGEKVANSMPLTRTNPDASDSNQ